MKATQTYPKTCNTLRWTNQGVETAGDMMVSRTKSALENIALQLGTKNTGKTAFIFLVRLGFRFSDCGNYTNKHEVFSQLLVIDQLLQLTEAVRCHS